MSAENAELQNWKNLAMASEVLYSSLKTAVVNLQSELIAEIRAIDDETYYDNDSEAVGYGKQAAKEEIFDRLNAITNHFPHASA